MFRLYNNDVLLKSTDDLPSEIKFYISSLDNSHWGLALVWQIIIDSPSDVQRKYRLKKIIDQKGRDKFFGLERFENVTEVTFVPPNTIIFSIKSVQKNDSSFRFHVYVYFNVFSEASTSTVLKIEGRELVCILCLYRMLSLYLLFLQFI